MKLRNNIKEFITITIGTAIVAAAVFFFMLPSHVSVGSGAALAMVLSNFIPMSVSTITLIMNVGLLIIGFILVGPEFGLKTVYCSILMPIMMGILEFFFPDFQSITQDPLLDVICYIMVVGVDLSILFPHNASSGGLDIVAKIMNKYLKVDIGYAMSTSGMLVALSSALCYESNIVILSLHDQPEWGRIYTHPNEEFGLDAVAGEVVGVVRKGLEEHPEIGAVVLECTDLPPYASRIRDELDIPVFDINSMIGHVAMALNEHNLY